MQTRDKTHHSPWRSMASWQTRFQAALVLAILWYALAGNQGWYFAVPAILFVIVLSSGLIHANPLKLSLIGLLGFLGYFITRSVLGGVDVALRAMAPSMPITIRHHDYRFRCRGRAARTLFIASLSLMPGTLSMDMKDADTVRVHSIAGDVKDELEGLERRAAALFGEVREHPA